MEKKKLSDKEKLYFYDILYKYEHDVSHAGYRPEVFLEKLADLVSINDNYVKGTNITMEESNALHFTPYNNNVCWAILYHVRNSMDHGNLYSTIDMKSFIIFDYSDREKR